MKKATALILALLVMCGLLVACGDSGDDESAAASSTAEVSAPPATSGTESGDASTGDLSGEESSEEGEVFLLPEKFWNNTTLKMCVNKNRFYEEFEFWWDEALDDVVVTAIVDRTNLIESKYGIKIQMEYVDKLGGTKAKVAEAIEAGLPLDLIADGVSDIAADTLNGWYYDIREENSKFNDGKGYIDFDASWWDQTSLRDLSMGNKVFFVTGDICISDDEATWGMFFNRDMITNHGLEDPYDLVENHEWTLDKLYEMACTVSVKTGETMSFKPDDGDTWGMVAQAYDGLMFMLGCDQRMVQKDENDLPVLRIMEDANVNAFTKIYDILTDMENIGVADYFGAWNSGVYADETQIFCNGNALFMPQAMSALGGDVLANTDVNYGIIPMPLYDETQDEYTSSSTVYWHKVVAIPYTNNENLECTLFALEALAYYGQKYVTPAYYEKVLKGQKMKDEKSEEMLDLIFRNRSYDMSTCYNFGVGNVIMIQFYSSCLGNKQENKIISNYETNEPTYQAAIDNAIALFQSKG